MYTAGWLALMAPKVGQRAGFCSLLKGLGPSLGILNRQGWSLGWTYVVKGPSVHRLKEGCRRAYNFQRR